MNQRFDVIKKMNRNTIRIDQKKKSMLSCFKFLQGAWQEDISMISPIFCRGQFLQGKGVQVEHNFIITFILSRRSKDLQALLQMTIQLETNCMYDVMSIYIPRMPNVNAKWRMLVTAISTSSSINQKNTKTQSDLSIYEKQEKLRVSSKRIP